jgi:hypothetical protein
MFSSVRRTYWWTVGVLLGGLAVTLACRQGNGRRAVFQSLQPEYRVTELDLSGGIMVLQKANHRYIVRCQEYCSWFRNGKSYRMQNVTNGLQFDTDGRSVTLPIVQEDVKFPLEGGRG